VLQLTQTWDDFGEQLTKTDALSRVWTYAYDNHGNLVSSQSPEQLKQGSSTKTTFAYEPSLNGLLKSRTVPGSGSAGQSVTYTRNALGQVTRAETRDGSNALIVAYDYGYDVAHRLASITDSRGNKSLSYTWTPGGRLAKLALSDNGSLTHQWDYKYDATGRPSALIAPNGQTVSFALDAGGRLIERSFGNSLTSKVSWLPDGSLASIEHLAGNSQVAKHAYTYDIWGNRSTASDTLSGVTQGKTYGYDALDRLKSVANGTASQDETTSFDLFGNRLTKSIGTPVTQSWTSTYDGANQLNQVQQTVGGTAVTTLLRYDDNGNLKKLCEAGSGSVSGTATDCSATGTGSATRTLTWNGLDQLVSLAKAGTAALNEAYAYDDAGRRLAKTSAGITTAYLYDGEAILGEWTGSVSGAPAAIYAQGGTDDPLIRLTGSTGTPDATAAYYAQDGIGNVSALLSAGSAANQSTQAGNTFSTSGDYSSGTYPGSQMKDGVTAPSNSTGWVGVVANGAALTVSLPSAAALDHVVLYAVSNYLPSAFVVEINQNGTWVQVASGSNADFAASGDGSFKTTKSFTPQSATALRVRFTGAVNSGFVWLTEAEVWSVAATAITQRFDAWGNVTQSSGNIPTYGYTGREPDASGLIFYRARYYHPGLGRFASRDPIGMQGGINPYAYAGGNPVGFNDPSGLLAKNAANDAVDYAGRKWDDFSRKEAASIAAYKQSGGSEADLQGTPFDILPFTGLEAGAAKLGSFAFGAATKLFTQAEATVAKETANVLKEILVIGRQVDTTVAKDWAGHTVLDIPNWTVAKNDQLMNEAIKNRQTVYVGSPQNPANLWDSVSDRATVFARELRQFLDAGYRQIGDYLHPPAAK
jgi:RHS repeat-associated protein